MNHCFCQLCRIINQWWILMIRLIIMFTNIFKLHPSFKSQTGHSWKFKGVLRHFTLFTLVISNVPHIFNTQNIVILEVVYVVIGNPDFCLAFYLTVVYFRGDLQHVGRVDEQKIKCRPKRTRETAGVRL